MAYSTLLRSCQAGQLAYSPASWTGLLLGLITTCAYIFASNGQLLFLNQGKLENGRRNDFMINLHDSYAAKLGFKLVIPGSAVSLATDCTIEPSHKYSMYACV